MQAVAADQFIGKSLGAYHIDQLLAHRNVSAVYRAFDAGGQAVMLTAFLLPETFSPQERTRFLARFRQQAALLVKLEHPHILPVLSSGEHAGCAYLVTPFEQGNMLGSLLQRRERPAFQDLLTIVSQVAQGLDYAHKYGVLHGTLNPANIMLNTGGSVRIAGFGLRSILSIQGLRDLSGYAHAHLLSIGGTFLGAPEYIAPEAVQGLAIDGRADIYALGTLLFELLTGSPPFTGDNPLAVALQHVQQDVPDLATRLPGVPNDLAAVMNRALTRDPSQRFQSAGELATAFERAVHSWREALQRSVQASQPGLTDPQDTSPLTIDWHALENSPVGGKLSLPGIISSDGATGGFSLPGIPADDVPDMDPFAWWADVGSTHMRVQMPAGARKKRTASKQSRRQAVALIATGGVVALGGLGLAGFALRHFMNKGAQVASAPLPTPTPNAEGAVLPSHLAPTPTPTPAPAATSQPTPVATTAPTPTPTPVPQHTGTVIAATSMPANSAQTFTNPANGRTSILVHLPNGNFAAYDIACTHDGVTVYYDKGIHVLVCPRHTAYFDPANNAAVLQGPPPRPLPRVPIRVNADGTVTTG